MLVYRNVFESSFCCQADGILTANSTANILLTRRLAMNERKRTGCELRATNWSTGTRWNHDKFLHIMRACSIDAKDHLEKQSGLAASRSSLFLHVIQYWTHVSHNEISIPIWDNKRQNYPKDIKILPEDIAILDNNFFLETRCVYLQIFIIITA